MHNGYTNPGLPRLEDVSEILAVSAAQANALARSGDLPAINIGRRGQWRIEARVLEDWIAAQYEQARPFVADHPLWT